jgi:putative ABC transport system ATP-binding protein
MACLEMVGLGKWADHRLRDVRRPAAAREPWPRPIANRPRLILADEPTDELGKRATRPYSLFRAIIHAEALTMRWRGPRDLAKR